MLADKLDGYSARYPLLITLATGVALMAITALVFYLMWVATYGSN